jgi:hypothetical protein
MMASGSVRLGLSTSSPAVETASTPMKEKKIIEAAAPMPAIPSSANGSRLLGENAVSAIAMNITRTRILITTMIAFAGRGLARPASAGGSTGSRARSRAD